MKRILNLLFAWCAAAQFAMPASALAQADDPETLVKSTSEEVLSVIRQTTDRQKLQQLAEEKVVPHFDFPRMTQLAVGRAWRDATPEQRQEIEKQFRELLVRTYTNALAAGTHGRAQIRFKPSGSPPKGPETVVKTQAVEPGKPPIAIDYQMASTSGGWKVYDVTVDGVSLVTNYRQSFASTVSQSGIDGLIHSLTEKNRGQPR